MDTSKFTLSVKSSSVRACIGQETREESRRGLMASESWLSLGIGQTRRDNRLGVGGRVAVVVVLAVVVAMVIVVVLVVVLADNAAPNEQPGAPGRPATGARHLVRDRRITLLRLGNRSGEPLKRTADRAEIDQRR
ncbi:hypothetical protein V1478_001339 [Vespula squamosa]|uniref:Uncharacterized protein n=1 Tax=Vespula squamosa TaxID=30214 RepID=A0ABD2C167_VESSQ